MAYILALIVGLGSVGLYMAAFFFPEVYRKNDFVLSGLGMFYALVLWVCAGRMTGGVLLGQVASVTLLGWLSWQGLEMRRSLTPVDQQTRLPGSARTLGDVLRKSAQELPGQLQQQASRLSLPAALGGLAKRTTRSVGSVPARSPKRLTKQLQDGDRSLKPRVQQPGVEQAAAEESSGQTSSGQPSSGQQSSVKAPNIRPARKRPVQPVDPPVVEAIAPLPVDAAPPGDLSVPPAIASEPLLDLPSTDSTAAPPPNADPKPLTSATADIPTTALDDDFGLDDELTPTRATAAELRELAIQSAASRRRPNWFTTLKQRLQTGRNAGKRSPQPVSPPISPLDPMVPAVETAPDTNLETSLELNPGTNPDPNPDPNPDTETAFATEILEAVEAIAATVDVETLMTSPEEDWDLGWMEASPPEVAAAAEFEGAGFPEPDGSVTINVEAETIPTLETDSASAFTSNSAANSAAETEWDLDWAGEVLAADSAAEAVMNSGIDSGMDSGMEAAMDSGMEAAMDSGMDSGAESSDEFSEEPRADDWAEADAELEAETQQATWDTWEESTNLDEPSSALPLFIEEEVELLSTESSWLDAEIIAPSPDLLELLEEEDTEAIAFPTEDFSELLSSTAEPEAIDYPEAIAPVEQIEALAKLAEGIAPLLDPDEGLIDLDESLILIDETQRVVDESLSLVDETQRVMDESLIVVDESQSVMDESRSVSNESLILVDETLIIVDESQSVVDESLIVMDESLIVVDESLIVVDETQSVIGETLIVIDEYLSEEFGLTEPENEPETIFGEQTGFDENEEQESAENFGGAVDTDLEASTVVEIPLEPPDDALTNPPTRSTGRGLMIQVVKIEASEAGSEPISESDVEEP